MSLQDLFTTASTGAQSTISKSVERQTYGIVNRGVNTVAGVFNNSVQSGLSRFLSKGSQQILDAVGISRNSLPELGNISAAITSAGVTAAGQIFQGIVNGNVTQKSVNQLSSYDVAKAAAANNNTTAQHMFAISNLVQIAQTQGVTDSLGSIGQAPGIPDAVVKHYASDLLQYAPKYKFLYVVEFIFNASYANTTFKNDFAFLIKQFDRPNINIVHDDVNMYGYRTKVPKMTSYEPITVQIHDDIQNRSMNFFVSYLRSISPIANARGSSDPTSLQADSMQYDMSGSYGDTPTNNHSSSFGPLYDNAVTVLQSMNLYHVYDYGQFMNVYNFKNPKIIQMSLDALSMEESGGSGVTLQLAYDTVYIETGVAAAGNINQKEIYDGIQLTDTLSGVESSNIQQISDSITHTLPSDTNLTPNTSVSPTASNLFVGTSNTAITGVTDLTIPTNELANVVNSFTPKF